MGESDSKTISTLTTTVSNVSMGMMVSEEGKMADGRSEYAGKWKEEICEVLKKDREEMRGELEARLAEDRKSFKELMDTMMRGIAEVGLKMKQNNDDK